MVASENHTEEKNDREFVLTRVFAAPARILFRAMSKPEFVMQWFGPEVCPLAMCEMDFRVGGKYRFAMRSPQTGEMMTPFGGEYLEIVENQKVSFTNTFEQPGSETMVVTFTFEEKSGKTTLTHHTLFGSAAMKKQHLEMGYRLGLGSSIDLFARLAERLFAEEAGPG